MEVRNSLKKFRLWLRRFWSLIKEILLILFAALVSVFALWSGSEPKIRIAGLTLQVFGIITVAWGFHQFFFQWLKRLPAYHLPPINASCDIKLSAVTPKVRAEVSSTGEFSATTDERIEVLEKNVEEINNRISQTQNEMDLKVRELKQAIEDEKKAREKGDKEIRSWLDSIEKRSLRLSAVGAILLGIGVVMSSASPEIAKLIVTLLG
jgi:hypothetical protein